MQRGTKELLPGRSIMPVSTCSTTQALTLLQQAGYQVVSDGKGSHNMAKKPGAPMMTLPGGRVNLSVGVAKNLAPVLGIKGVRILQQVVTGGISFHQAVSH
jgi:predicted RNA binding protein YcfA (HicA-like mRNA interferase family)